MENGWMVKAVIFDLDDTLILEDNYIRSGYHALEAVLRKKYGLTEPDIAGQLYALYEENSRNVFNRFLDSRGISYTREDIMALVEAYRNHLPDIALEEDAAQLLEALHEKNIHTGIITDGYLSTQKNKVQVLGLDKAVDKIIYTEELGREYWKPHIKAFSLMKEYFQADYADMVYVGDNPEKDFRVKTQAPLTTIRIIRDRSVYKDAPYLDGVKEDIRVRDLREILTLVEEKRL
jgi:putative hydrolase of the HAD superfamily